ncbi:saccharopine dehydrogenase family protein [Mycolicibacterium sphagni]|uniref:Enoyl-ACP reductase n=1 Tax=Mycolicibacterium sphagni TaxID=1786 RepID=A0A255DIC4_9MYCO|nr:saccharopine dehydrogenase NADP-binding domain-containing protein [Mycolicibacterium sphagni]MCV7178271.1 saccharopine dehydrogenase NADP-binding domain-containing protein [Mycolicibacterium sphagni]OYN79197.1 enoyl-ACP reductase [Mycolicibacterium sphagni]
MRGGREVDITIFGATGFVGKLIAGYLARSGTGLTIALAGRSQDRLEAVRSSFGGRANKWPLVIADVDQPGSLDAMASRSRLVLNAVGPYTRYGPPVVAACAGAGTDYIDLTGEVPFVRRSIDQSHGTAQDTGARIVHSCGFDSIPSDLTVYALSRRAAADGTGELGETTLVLRDYSGGYAGGSVATMVDLMRLTSSDAEVRRMLDDPYSLSPDRAAEPDLGHQVDLPLLPGQAIAPELAGLWTSGYVMALYNTRCVRRSNALMEWAYGRSFHYTETLIMGSFPGAALAGAMFNAGITTASRFGGHYLRLLPTGLVDRMTPAAGTGNDMGSRGHYRVETYATTTTGRRYRATIAQPADPGYSATAVLAGESALALVLDRDRLPDRHGVLTPASAMGDVLLDRLPAAGVTFETVSLP